MLEPSPPARKRDHQRRSPVAEYLAKDATLPTSPPTNTFPLLSLATAWPLSAELPPRGFAHWIWPGAPEGIEATTVMVAEVVAPKLSATVSVTVLVPAAEYV